MSAVRVVIAAQIILQTLCSPNEDFGSVTKDEMCVFEVLLEGPSTLFWPLVIEKSIENPRFIICSSFQNFRLGGINLSQKIIASQENQHIASLACCYYLLYHLANFLQRS